MVKLRPFIASCCVSLLLVLSGFQQLYGQMLPFTGKVGAGTQPYTVVYRLKSIIAADPQARAAQPAKSDLPAIHQKIGAKNIQQKFPRIKAPTPQAENPESASISDIYQLQHSPSLSFEEVRKALMATGLVEYVEPLYRRVPLHQPNDPSADSLKTNQYYLKLIQAYGGWAVEKGDTNVVIGILDTGFRLTHADLKSKVKRNYNDPIDGIDNDGDGYVDNFEGWDFSDNDNSVLDDTPYKEHGTNVAGVAAAATDNGIGIASVGFNLKFMPLKVFSSAENGPFSGFEALVYAAEKGCKVINLSWGGEEYSRYEQDIINYVVLQKDVVVVAAAGNINENINIYPAAYDNVLSVGGTDQKDVKYADYTYNYLVDICAPSVAIQTTGASNDNAYRNGWGSSFASPMTAGAAGLVRSKFPNLRAQQVMERLRVTSDDVYRLDGNKPYQDMLGKGRLNVKRALREPAPKAARNTSFAIKDNKVIQIGDTVLLELYITNFLAPVENLSVRVSSPSPFVTILQEDVVLGSMGTLETANNRARPVKLIFSEATPVNHDTYFRLTFSGTGYEDFQYIRLQANPDFITLKTEKLQVTVNNSGNFGYNGHNFEQGVGVRYRGGLSLLYEAGLMVATDATHVSDNVLNEKKEPSMGFRAVSQLKFDYKSKLADQEVRGIMQDMQSASTAVGVEVKHKAFAWQSEGNQDFIILEYDIKNISSHPLASVYAGLFADWDIGDAFRNAADWVEELQLGYVYNTSRPHPYAGVKLLTPDAPSYYAIDNAGGGETSIGITDGFSASEKFRTLSEGVARKQAKGTGAGGDVSHVIGASAQNLAPGETKTVAFAILAANNLVDLKKHAQAAQQKYISIKSGPPPLAANDTVCIDSPVVVKPEGGTRYHFYADRQKLKRLAAAATYEIEHLKESTTLYISNADSLFESSLVAAQLVVADAPVAQFSIVEELSVKGLKTVFKNESTRGHSWLWDFGTGATSTEEAPRYTFEQAGSYVVKLSVTDRFGCTASTSKVIEVVSMHPTASGKAFSKSPLTLYPNPTTGLARLRVPHLHEGGAKGDMPKVTVTDVTGRSTALSVYPTADAQELTVHFEMMPAGIYQVQIRYRDGTFTQKVLLLKN